MEMGWWLALWGCFVRVLLWGSDGGEIKGRFSACLRNSMRSGPVICGDAEHVVVAKSQRLMSSGRRLELCIRCQNFGLAKLR